MARTWPYTKNIMLDDTITVGRVAGWGCVRYATTAVERRWTWMLESNKDHRPCMRIHTDDPGIHADLQLSW